MKKNKKHFFNKSSKTALLFDTLLQCQKDYSNLIKLSRNSSANNFSNYFHALSEQRVHGCVCVRDAERKRQIKQMTLPSAVSRQFSATSKKGSAVAVVFIVNNERNVHFKLIFLCPHRTKNMH